MNAPQIPTIGRIVHFYEYASQQVPFAAIIINIFDQHPNSESRVSLDVIDPYNGAHRFVQGISPGDQSSIGWHYRWPPHV